MTSCRLPVGERDCERNAVRVDDQVCLELERARSTGEGPTWSPFEGPDVRAVRGAVIQVKQVGVAQLAQQGGVQAGPDAGFRPVPQPAPSSHSGVAHSLRGDVAPGDAGSQYVHHAGKCHPVGNTQPPGMAAAPFGSGR
ncbi:hypothetical protein GCM10010270_79550 [Streptomyces violaceus]|nr:hypothetical protein GCM10010270_79550 [Streptomyces janthinus]